MEFTSKALMDKTGHTLFRVVYKSDNGRETIKTLSLEDYLNLLGANIREKKSFDHLPPSFFPEGYIDGWVADRANYAMIWRHTSRVHALHHRSCGVKLIPFPDLVFVLHVHEGHHQAARVYAAKNNNLFQYPFGNVSTDGYICMGNIHVKGLEDGPRAFQDDFFAGETNNDYFGPGTHVRLKCRQEELIKKLAGKEEFPSKWLKRNSDNPATVDELVRTFSTKF